MFNLDNFFGMVTTTLKGIIRKAEQGDTSQIIKIANTLIKSIEHIRKCVN